MTPEELPGYLRSIAGQVRDRAALDAADAMAQAYQVQVVRSMTGTSAPGKPPARRTGTLARSVRAQPARLAGSGRAESSVAPHTVYARIQHKGGWVRIVRAKVLTDGKNFYGTAVYLPARPYMVMTSQRRRQARDAAVRAVQKVVREAIAGG